MTRTQAVTELMDRNKEEVEARIAYGIEAHRKGSFCLRLMDESGVPAAGVRVKIEQIGHEFQHGANLFMLDQHETAEKNKNTARHLRNVSIWPRFRFTGIRWSRKRETRVSARKVHSSTGGRRWIPALHTAGKTALRRRRIA